MRAKVPKTLIPILHWRKRIVHWFPDSVFVYDNRYIRCLFEMYTMRCCKHPLIRNKCSSTTTCVAPIHSIAQHNDPGPFSGLGREKQTFCVWNLLLLQLRRKSYPPFFSLFSHRTDIVFLLFLLVLLCLLVFYDKIIQLQLYKIFWWLWWK